MPQQAALVAADDALRSAAQPPLPAAANKQAKQHTAASPKQHAPDQQGRVTAAPDNRASSTQPQVTQPISSTMTASASAASDRQLNTQVKQPTPRTPLQQPRSKQQNPATTQPNGRSAPPHMSITWLGTSSGNPSMRRNVSSIALRHGESTHLVDCGEGTSRQVLRFGIEPTSICEIYISHLHGDHCFGLPGMIELISQAHRASGSAPGSEHLTVQGPPGIQQLIKTALAVSCRCQCKLHQHSPAIASISHAGSCMSESDCKCAMANLSLSNSACGAPLAAAASAISASDQPDMSFTHCPICKHLASVVWQDPGFLSIATCSNLCLALCGAGRSPQLDAQSQMTSSY